MTPDAVRLALPGWRTLLDALGDAAWVVDAQVQRVLAANAGALALLGLDAPALLGQPADALLATPEDLAYWDEARAAAGRPVAQGPGTLQSDTTLVDAGGRLVQVTRRVRALGPTDAPPEAYLVVVHDRSAAQQEADELGWPSSPGTIAAPTTDDDEGTSSK